MLMLTAWVSIEGDAGGLDLINSNFIKSDQEISRALLALAPTARLHDFFL